MTAPPQHTQVGEAFPGGSQGPRMPGARQRVLARRLEGSRIESFPATAKDRLKDSILR